MMLYVLFKEKAKPFIETDTTVRFPQTYTDTLRQADKWTDRQRQLHKTAFRLAKMQLYNRQFGLSLG